MSIKSGKTCFPEAFVPLIPKSPPCGMRKSLWIKRALISASGRSFPQYPQFGALTGSLSLKPGKPDFLVTFTIGPAHCPVLYSE